MKSYVIFNKKTGDITHTHTEVALSGEPLPVSKEDLIGNYRGRPGYAIEPEDLDVLEVDRDLLQQGQSNRKDLYVDVKRRAVVERPK